MKLKDRFKKLSIVFYAFFLGFLVFSEFDIPIYPLEELIEVVEVVWTTEIDKENRVFLNKHEEVAPCKPLYLWMRVKGRQEALDYLKNNGELPIRHKWYKQIGTTVLPDTCEKLLIDDVLFSNIKQAKIRKLELELEKRGFFDYRIWSVKNNIRRGMWIVTIVYPNNSPVFCMIGEDKGPCRYQIKVK